MVLAPPPCLPPYASDGLALDDVVVRAASFEEYVHDLRELCVKPDRRVAQGLQVRASVLRHHTGSGWSAYLTAALQHAPPEHKVQLPVPGQYTPAAAYRHWSSLMIELGTEYRTTFERSWHRSLVLGLSPRLDEDVLRRLRAFEGVRAGHTVPLLSMWLFEKVVAPMMPRPIRPQFLRFLFAASRPHRVRKVRAKTLFVDPAPGTTFRGVLRIQEISFPRGHGSTPSAVRAPSTQTKVRIVDPA